jgi:hemolysin activation/secretion protein
MMNRCFPPAVRLLACLLVAGAWLRAAEATPAPPEKANLLRQILIADTVEAAQALSHVPDGGFLIVSPKLGKIDQVELLRRLKSGENKPITERLLAAVAQVVEVFMRSSGYAIATAIIPPQNIGEGALRVAVLPGKVRNIKIEGNRWFSESLLREKLRIERGGLVQVAELDQSLAWTNGNQFRRVKLHVEPVADTGEADLFFAVQERFPLRFTAGYENTGNEILGLDRYSGTVTYGNLWGLDHQVSYQQAMSHSTKLLRVHAFDYRAPLPWRHILTVSASSAKVNPTFFSGLFTQLGKSVNADVKYVIPTRLKQWEGEVTAGLSFKQTNNNLEFGGQFADFSMNDLFSASLSASAVRPDQRGRWVVSATLTGSPGDFNSRNTDETLGKSRFGARSRYLYGQAWAQRVTFLAPGLSSIARLSTQLAGTNLVPSEQFSAGGLNTVRGYEERVLSGDSGFVFSHEVQRALPAIPLGKKLPRMDLVGAFFWDYGRTIIKHPLIGETKAAYLSSVGLGLRCSVGSYFSATADYGRQLEQIETPGAPHHRLHVKMSLAY